MAWKVKPICRSGRRIRKKNLLVSYIKKREREKKRKERKIHNQRIDRRINFAYIDNRDYRAIIIYLAKKEEKK